jgi:hypothetical protein
VYADSFIINLQTGDWCSTEGNFADAPHNRPWTDAPSSTSIFDPQNMAASAAY